MPTLGNNGTTEMDLYGETVGTEAYFYTVCFLYFLWTSFSLIL